MKVAGPSACSGLMVSSGTCAGLPLKWRRVAQAGGLLISSLVPQTTEAGQLFRLEKKKPSKVCWRISREETQGRKTRLILTVSEPEHGSNAVGVGTSAFISTFSCQPWPPIEAKLGIRCLNMSLGSLNSLFSVYKYI